jgi:hypothetical protein
MVGRVAEAENGAAEIRGVYSAIRIPDRLMDLEEAFSRADRRAPMQEAIDAVAAPAAERSPDRERIVLPAEDRESASQSEEAILQARSRNAEVAKALAGAVRLVVPNEERAEAIEMGAVVDPRSRSLVIPPGADRKMASALSERYGAEPVREFITVPPDKLPAALEQGAHWDPVQLKPYIPKGLSEEQATRLRLEFSLGQAPSISEQVLARIKETGERLGVAPITAQAPVAAQLPAAPALPKRRLVIRPAEALPDAPHMAAIGARAVQQKSGAAPAAPAADLRAAPDVPREPSAPALQVKTGLSSKTTIAQALAGNTVEQLTAAYWATMAKYDEYRQGASTAVDARRAREYQSGLDLIRSEFGRRDLPLPQREGRDRGARGIG